MGEPKAKVGTIVGWQGDGSGRLPNVRLQDVPRNDKGDPKKYAENLERIRANSKRDREVQAEGPINPHHEQDEKFRRNWDRIFGKGGSDD
jgi:hypothetical protein